MTSNKKKSRPGISGRDFSCSLNYNNQFVPDFVSCFVASAFSALLALEEEQLFAASLLQQDLDDFLQHECDSLSDFSDLDASGLASCLLVVVVVVVVVCGACAKETLATKKHATVKTERNFFIVAIILVLQKYDLIKARSIVNVAIKEYLTFLHNSRNRSLKGLFRSVLQTFPVTDFHVEANIFCLIFFRRKRKPDIPK
jgi:hypothetical protein